MTKKSSTFSTCASATMVQKAFSAKAE